MHDDVQRRVSSHARVDRNVVCSVELKGFVHAIAAVHLERVRRAGEVVVDILHPASRESRNGCAHRRCGAVRHSQCIVFYQFSDGECACHCLVNDGTSTRSGPCSGAQENRNYHSGGTAGSAFDDLAHRGRNSPSGESKFVVEGNLRPAARCSLPHIASRRAYVVAERIDHIFIDCHATDRAGARDYQNVIAPVVCSQQNVVRIIGWVRLAGRSGCGCAGGLRHCSHLQCLCSHKGACNPPKYQRGANDCQNLAGGRGCHPCYGVSDRQRSSNGCRQQPVPGIRWLCSAIVALIPRNAGVATAALGLVVLRIEHLARG